MLKTIVAAILAGTFLTGCAAGVTHMRYSLEPRPNECQSTESRPTWQSNIVSTVCWDAQGNPIGMGSAPGTSTAAVATSLIGSTATAAAGASTIVGATILGKDVIRAADKLGNMTVTTTGNVTTSGTVTGSVTGTIAPLTVQPIPPLTVQPVPPLTGTINLVPVLP